MTSFPLPPTTGRGPMIDVPGGGVNVITFVRGIFELGRLYTELRFIKGTTPSLAGAANVPGLTPPLGVIFEKTGFPDS